MGTKHRTHFMNDKLQKTLDLMLSNSIKEILEINVKWEITIRRKSVVPVNRNNKTKQFIKKTHQNKCYEKGYHSFFIESFEHWIRDNI